MSNNDRVRDFHTTNAVSIVAFAGVAVTATTCLVLYQRRYRQYLRGDGLDNNNYDNNNIQNNNSYDDEIIRRLQQQRKEERTGRIRAEVRLRTTLKQLQQLQVQLFHKHQYMNNNDTKNDINDDNGLESSHDDTIIGTDLGDSMLHDTNSNDTMKTKNTTFNNLSVMLSQQQQQQQRCSRTMLLQCIGTIVTPYTKRMGTPRQGALVPASRGYIEFDKQVVSAETISGLELYSHIWILFEFHANTDLGSTNSNTGCIHDTTTTNGTSTRITKTKKSKIRPPRGNGIKVGQLATRSPHRPNPIGLSLVMVERWDSNTKRLYIRGMDIVNGTPVYDIKPVVPWDVPGYSNDSDGISNKNIGSVLVVPDWVSNNEDVIPNVDFTSTAKEQLHQCIMDGKLAPLYTYDNDDGGAMETIQQILKQDPRSSHKGLKTNARGTKQKQVVLVTDTKILHNDDPTTNAITSCYSIIFCQVRVSFNVTDKEGCIVTDIVPIEFVQNQYVDGIPVLTEGVVEDIGE